jgi:hypothetical protein
MVSLTPELHKLPCAFVFQHVHEACQDTKPCIFLTLVGAASNIYTNDTQQSCIIQHDHRLSRVARYTLAPAWPHHLSETPSACIAIIIGQRQPPQPLKVQFLEQRVGCLVCCALARQQCRGRVLGFRLRCHGTDNCGDLLFSADISVS